MSKTLQNVIINKFSVSLPSLKSSSALQLCLKLDFPKISLEDFLPLAIILSSGIKCPTGGDLNAFASRVDKVRYKMLYLEKESRQKYNNFGQQLLCLEFSNDNVKDTKLLT